MSQSSGQIVGSDVRSQQRTKFLRQTNDVGAVGLFIFASLSTLGIGHDRSTIRSTPATAPAHVR